LFEAFHDLLGGDSREAEGSDKADAGPLTRAAVERLMRAKGIEL